MFYGKKNYFYVKPSEPVDESISVSLYSIG